MMRRTRSCDDYSVFAMKKKKSKVIKSKRYERTCVPYRCEKKLEEKERRRAERGG